MPAAADALAAVGYQNGQVVVWDLSTQAIVKALPDVHKAPVVHVRFLNEYSQLISGDVTGTSPPVSPRAGVMSALSDLVVR